MDATKIWVEALDSTNASISKACVGVEEFKQIQTLKYEFQVISDEQVSVGNDAFVNRTIKTFKDIKKESPNSKVIVSNGDIVDEGKASNYDSFNEAFTGVFGENSTQKQLIGIGNHEFIDQSENGSEASQDNAITAQRFTDRLNLWKEKTGNENQYFYEEIEGSYFIFLGTTAIPHTLSGNTRADCTLGETQLNWLKDTMINAGKTNKPIYLFSHGSLRDTVSGSLSELNQTWYGYTEDEETKLRNIIKDYPQTLFFSSHSHWSFESKNPYLISDDYPSFFNTAAIGYLWEGEGGGRHYNDKDYENGGAQGLYIDVYDKQVVIKGRQFEATDDARSTYWFSGYQVVLPL
jgi:3',5'-cyclic-AMP phosphodiesterase